MSDDVTLVPIAWVKIITGLFVLLLAGCGATWWLGVREGQSREHRKAYELERHALVDSIRIADLVKDSTARELREASMVRDSAASAQRAKRKTFTVTSDTTILVIGDTLPAIVPAPVISYIRGADAQVAVDSAWLAKIAADTAAIAEQRDLWKRRALAAETELERRKPSRFGLKSGIAIGITTTLLLAHAVANLVR